MRTFVTTALLALAACSGAQPGNRAADPADVNAAAAEAQGDIDDYAANTVVAARSRASVTAAPGPSPTFSESAVPADDPAAVLRRYFDALAARDYATAYRLWDDGGAASGMSARQFADSFTKYATYRATVGVPGRIDAGAGQRHVEVPVRVSGTLLDGNRPFALRGTLVLHKTADIDGATAEQRSWHISQSNLRPRPDAAAAAAPTDLVTN